MFVSPKEASKYYNVSKETLRLRAISGEIEYIITPGGHHRYKIIPIDVSKCTKTKVIYARVSSQKQKKTLKNKSNLNTLTTKLSKTLELDLTLKEEGLSKNLF